jgi:hypothetical protein
MTGNLRGVRRDHGLEGLVIDNQSNLIDIKATVGLFSLRSSCDGKQVSIPKFGESKMDQGGMNTNPWRVEVRPVQKVWCENICNMG